LTPKGDEDAAGDDVTMGDERVSGTAADVAHADFDKLAKELDVANESILAADCCIALLGSDRLTKQVAHSSCYVLHFLIPSL
jgi:cohesin loading factor subunit SCC2